MTPRRASCMTLGLLLGVGLLLPRQAEAQRPSLAKIEQKLTSIEGMISRYLSAIRPPKRTLSSRELSKRLIDGMVLYRMKDYSRASIIFMDIVKNYTATPQASTANFFLADSMFQQREFLVARNYYTKVVGEGAAHQYYQYALQRLLELEMRRQTFFGSPDAGADQARLAQVEDMLRKIQSIPAHRRQPSVEYVRAKFLYFRKRYKEALAAFAGIGTKHPYYLQAIYFTGVCNIQQSRLNAAAATYKKLIDRVLFAYFKPKKKTERRMVQLIVMAAARLAYFRGRRQDIPRALELYSAIPRKSPYFADSLYERAWAYLKAKNYDRAIKALQLLRAADPDYERSDEARVLLGNLRIQTQDFPGAKRVFRTASRELLPVYRKLRGLRLQNLDPKIFFEQLTAKNLDRFDIKVRLPKLALHWLRKQPGVKRALLMLKDMSQIRKMVKESERLIKQIDKQMKSGSQIASYPSLALARSRAADVETQVLQLRSAVSSYIRDLMHPKATAAERARLDSLRKKRQSMTAKLKAAPKSSDAYKDRVRKTKALFDGADGDALAVKIQIESLERQLNALIAYYNRTSAKQTLRRQTLQRNVVILRTYINSLKKLIVKIREDIVDARNAVGIGDAVMRYEAFLRKQIKKVLADERQMAALLASRLSASERYQKTKLDGLLGRLDGAQKNLDAINARIDRFLAVKRAQVARVLTEERANLKQYKVRLAKRSPESKRVVGGVTYQNFNRVSKKVYDIVIKADIGVLDVVWAIKNLAKGAYEKQEGAFLRAMEHLKSKYAEPRGEQ